MVVPIQKGTDLKIGFGAFVYTGFIPEDGLKYRDGFGNVIITTDTDGATFNKILMDQREIIEISFVILDVGGSITPPTHGDAVTITIPLGGAVVFMAEEDTAIEHSRGPTRLTFTGIKEASMTYV